MNNLDLFAPRNDGQSEPQGERKSPDVSVQSPIAGNAHSGECEGGKFFNTTGETGDELAKAKRRNGAQNAVILAVFKAAESPLGPWEVMHRCHAAGHQFLIGSVRRAITTLTKDGALTKLATKRRGDAGANEHEWRAA